MALIDRADIAAMPEDGNHKHDDTDGDQAQADPDRNPGASIRVRIRWHKKLAKEHSKARDHKAERQQRDARADPREKRSLRGHVNARVCVGLLCCW